MKNIPTHNIVRITVIAAVVVTAMLVATPASAIYRADDQTSQTGDTAAIQLMAVPADTTGNDVGATPTLMTLEAETTSTTPADVVTSTDGSSTGKESGEKGGTTDMNIGIGELQEAHDGDGDLEVDANAELTIVRTTNATPGTELDDIGAPATESRMLSSKDIFVVEEYQTRAGYVKLGDIKGESKDSAHVPDSFFDVFVDVGEESATADSFFDIWTEPVPAADGTTNLIDIVDIAMAVDGDALRDAADAAQDQGTAMAEIIHDLAPGAVATAEQFGDWLVGVVLHNDKIKNINLRAGAVVEVEYDEQAKLLGFIPIKITTTAQITAPTDGEEAAIEYSKKKWWQHLAITSRPNTTSGEVEVDGVFTAQGDWRNTAVLVDDFLNTLMAQSQSHVAGGINDATDAIKDAVN